MDTVTILIIIALALLIYTVTVVLDRKMSTSGSDNPVMVYADTCATISLVALAALMLSKLIGW